MSNISQVETSSSKKLGDDQKEYSAFIDEVSQHSRIVNGNGINESHSRASSSKGSNSDFEVKGSLDNQFGVEKNIKFDNYDTTPKSKNKPSVVKDDALIAFTPKTERQTVFLFDNVVG